MSVNHLFRPNGQYYDSKLASDKQNELENVIVPLVKRWLSEGYPLSEILHFIFVNTEFFVNIDPKSHINYKEEKK